MTQTEAPQPVVRPEEKPRRRRRRLAWRRYFDFSGPGGLRRLIAFMMGGAIAFIFVFLAAYRTFEYMESPEFCGELCHTVMKPELTVYKRSPHAKVNCVNCHIGPGADWLVKSKISGVRQVFAVLRGTYSRPIPTPVEELRPARETCEQCHWPQKFTEDRIRVYRQFRPDLLNSERTYTLAFRIGGGELDGATGIHWHIASQVYYLALDEKRQEIAWVGVERPDGSREEYFDPAHRGEVTPENLAEEKRLMDCIDCHNRATHVFRSPEAMVDEALARGRINRDLPYIKRKAMEALNIKENPSQQRTLTAIEALPSYYREAHPQVYEQKQAAIAAAVRELESIAETSAFPEMHLDWTTYENNIGHTRSPGCFRCHGKLVDQTSGQVMNAGCNLCHYALPGKPWELAGVGSGG